MEGDNEEFQHITEFNRLIKKIQQVKSLRDYCVNNNKEPIEHEKQLQELNQQLEIVSQSLSNFNPSPTTLRRYTNLARQLGILIEKLKFGRYGEKIDRNDGLILENYVYNTILQDIDGVFTNEFIGCSVPYYKYSIESDFDHEPIKALLTELKQEVVSNPRPPINYVELHYIHEQIDERILEVARNEYKANRIRENIFRY
ncbi:hypothetical protein [Pedobacter cryotolerans]|uniref:Uncharacterized protein n=1 Tax=Pedobacter cryotolerans TaxID=2571270 RepID=A0A4U1BU34_9SPHI|nr:hypothetical protein [Pedobacter cryotolerans]TKB96176.1 hypothetical protein FA045_18550 [Pedobacter cryotolerans]